MAKSPPIATVQQPPKLPRLSKNQKIQKRPLLHPAIASPHRSSTTQKAIYISSSSSFIATIKRVRKLLSHIESRSSSSIDFKQHSDAVLKQIEADVEKGKSRGREEEVVLKATGKAIEKCLRLAVWWLGQADVRVVVRTGSVGAVDDVVNKDDGEVGEEEGSRVRRTSCLEVGISLR